MSVWSLGVSVLSMIISAVVLGWNVYRDCIQKPKIKIRVQIIQEDINDSTSKVLKIKVTNVGKEVSVIDGHFFLLRDGTKKEIAHQDMYFYDKELRPNKHFTVTIELDLLEDLKPFIEDMVSFVVYDSKGKKWKLDRKNFLEIKKELKKIHGH